VLHILRGAAMQQINTLAPPDRIGEADPPSLIFWFNLYQVARNRGGISHFLAPGRGSHAYRGLHCGFCPRVYFFKNQRRIVKHPACQS
jgi:hypothetical protein